MAKKSRAKVLTKCNICGPNGVWTGGPVAKIVVTVETPERKTQYGVMACPACRSRARNSIRDSVERVLCLNIPELLNREPPSPRTPPPSPVLVHELWGVVKKR